MTVTLNSLNGQMLQKNILFNLDGISFSEYEDYDIVQIDDGVSCSEPGYPALPSLIYNYCIPQTSKASNVSLENQEWISLGYYDIIPQQQGSSSPDDTTFTPENDSVYSLNQFFPESPLITFNNGNMSGFMLTGAVICPFRYNPVTNELQMLLSTQIQIDYELNEEIAISLSPNQYNIFKDMVADLVDNDLDIIGYSPMVRELAEYEGLVEYVVIVNNESFVDYFEPLIRWKKARGIPSEVVTTSWINSTYSGVDIQEKIRHFLQDYHNRFGLIYANFAGTDNGIYRTIPIGYKFSSIGWVHYDVPCDMYFSDIVPYYYDWDENNNLIYGEYFVDNDACDWMGDILVGRIPVEDVGQVEDWVEDQIKYELYQNNDHSWNILLVGARLGDIALGSTACYLLYSEISSLFNVTGLFEENYSCPNFPSVPTCLQNGNIFCYISAHGNIGGTYWYGNVYHQWIPMLGQLLANTPPCFIVTPACNCGWFDNSEDCLAEKLTASEYSNGSRAIGTIMSSRLGVIYPHNTQIGPSDGIAVDISTYLIPETNDYYTKNTGAGFCTGRSNYAGLITLLTFPPGRFHYLVNNFNLLGDPESNLWYINDLESFSVFHNHYIHLTSQHPYPEYDVEVCKVPTGDGEPDPVEDAIVTISFPEENDNINNWGCYIDTTSQSGWVHMDYELYRSGTSDNIFDVVLTVQKPGIFKPFVDTLKHAYWYSDAGGYIGDLDWANYWDEGGAGGNSYGQYVIQKSTGEHLVLVKNGSIYKLIEANGELDTATVISNIDMDTITCFIETNDGYLIFVGGKQDINYLKKIVVYDNNYNYLNEYINSTEDIISPILDIIETSYQHYILLGNGITDDKFNWVRECCICDDGSFEFNKSFIYSDINSVYDSLKTVAKRSDGKYVMIGNSFWVVNTDGTIHSHVDYTTDSDPQDVAYIPDRNRFMIVGSTSSGGFIRETDVNGNEINFTEFSSNSHPYIYNINSITKVGLSESFVYCCSGQGWDPCLEESCAVLVTRDIYDIESGSFMFGNPFEVIYNQFWYKSTIANVCANNNGSVTFAGTMYHEDGSSDYAISKFGESKENMNPQNALNFNGQNIDLSFICSNNIIQDQALFRYSLPISSNINISIYNIAGQRVTTLENGFKNAGFHEITWNALDSKGSSVSNGCYFVRFTSDNYTETKNITVIR